MNKLFSTENVILMACFIVALGCFALAFKVYFFTYIGIVIISVAFAWLGIKLISRYNKERFEFEQNKQRSLAVLSQNYDELYARSVLDTSQIDSDFRKENLKYKIWGIICIIASLGFAYILLSEIM